jgi:peroxin-19
LPDGTKTTTEAATAQPGAAEDAFSEEEFAKQLQAGMADLLGELEKSVSAIPSSSWTLY